jgi:hypothetical protein
MSMGRSGFLNGLVSITLGCTHFFFYLNKYQLLKKIQADCPSPSISTSGELLAQVPPSPKSGGLLAQVPPSPKSGGLLDSDLRSLLNRRR